MNFLGFEPLRTFTYEEYLSLTEKAAAIKINFQRIQRLTKTIALKEEIDEQLKRLERKMQWIVIAETWCGDGAQNIPILAKIAYASDKIDLKIILRDENPGIMDAFLTNGTRSIPILICIDATSNKLVGTWGPRPKRVQEIVSDFKKENSGISHEQVMKTLHLWYAKDKGEALQAEMLDLLIGWHIYF